MRFLNLYIPLTMGVLTVCTLTDYFNWHRLIYNYAYCLWLGVAVSVANAAVFLSGTVFFERDYGRFYRHFWWAFCGIYLFILYIAFVREPNSYELTYNLLPGNGTFKYFRHIIRHPEDSYVVLICIGNIVVFSPLAFMLRNLLRKAPLYIFIIIGLLIPIAAETYQYVFRCGNVDIDDLLLNWSGFAVGLLVEEIIYKKKLSVYNE